MLLLLLYILYLWFQLRTHHNLFGAEAAAENVEQQSHSGPVAEPAQDISDDEDSETHMNPWAAGGVLIVTTIVVSICADYLVDSIDALVDRAGLSRNFIGLILIPIVGNAAEHVTAVVVAVKNKMDLVCNKSSPLDRSRIITYHIDTRLWELQLAPVSRSHSLLLLS